MFTSRREGRSPAESRPGARRLVRLGAAPGKDGDGSPPLRVLSARVLARIVGGTAEAMPFVPVWGGKAFLLPAPRSSLFQI